MLESPLSSFNRTIASAPSAVIEVISHALDRANHNRLRNTYVSISREWSLGQTNLLVERYTRSDPRPALFGLPISLKDCFDLEGFKTSCGSRFYGDLHGLAQKDSAIATALRRQGAIIVGKTHLHPLAYGITGENPEYGDCTQPRDHSLLTGGSSSGAAASVQEGSALAAIGTDTGGSIRVPAALCGLAGYRSSSGIGCWEGAFHLAPSFDTLGFLYRDLRDGPALAEAILDVPITERAEWVPRIAVVGPDFLHDCDPRIVDSLGTLKDLLRGSGATIEQVNTDFWADSMAIFAPIQASEAASIHRGYYTHFEPAIAARLEWGARISVEELSSLRARAVIFNQKMGAIFRSCDFLLLPCAPVAELRAGDDHGNARQIILRYTTPMSLAGNPVVAIPCTAGGMQLVAAHGWDSEVLSYSAYLGQKFLSSF